MPDLPARPSPSDASDAPAPRWVKVFGIVALVLVLVFVVVHLAGGGLTHHTAGGHAPRADEAHGSAHP